MLVISQTKDGDELHVLKRLSERFSNVDSNIERWFLSVLAEINCYLPDDWRMTKSSNNFRIQVITSHDHLSLMGYSFKRKHHKGIINIIDTILYKHYYDINEASNNKEKIGKKSKIKNPELIQPNLYYFQPRPEDSFSPLFARQYERVRYNKNNVLTGTQYHRIHPLTKEGLDLEHYKWVKWDINGNIEFVDYPDAEYHGKNYWLIPDLESQSNRTREEEYLEQYENYIKKYEIDNTQMNTVTPPPAEREFKFTSQGSKEEFNSLLEDIKNYLENENFQAIWGSPKKQEDLYFDDENYTLYNSGVTFRLRKQKGHSRITVKKKMPIENEYNTEGLYYRMEEEATISKTQEEALLRGERINPFPFRLIAYLAPGCGILKKALNVNNTRTTGLITDKLMQKIEICHDIVTYSFNEEEYGPQFEIEIESKGADPHLISLIADELKTKLDLKPSTKTKYERGISLFNN